MAYLSLIFIQLFFSRGFEIHNLKDKTKKKKRLTWEFRWGVLEGERFGRGRVLLFDVCLVVTRGRGRGRGRVRVDGSVRAGRVGRLGAVRASVGVGVLGHDVGRARDLESGLVRCGRHCVLTVCFKEKLKALLNFEHECKNKVRLFSLKKCL